MKGKPFFGKYSTPNTGARPQMRPTTLRGQAGSLQQAASQIRQAPAPFAGNGGLRNRPPSNAEFSRDQVQGSPAPGVRPRANTAAAPRSAPMSDSQIMRGAGYSKPVNYAGHAVHVQKNKSVRVMRNAIPGTKPLVKPMDSGDFFEGAALYRKEHGRL
jgi:hypothetical protein